MSEDEIPDFLAIQERLEKLSMTVDALRLWMENAIANGQFDRDTMERIKKLSE